MEWTALSYGLCLVFMLADETLARDENEGLLFVKCLIYPPLYFLSF